MIHTPDTDVFLLTINIADVKNQLDGKVSEQNINYVLEVLPGLYAFTSYNTVRAFSGKGKIKAWKIMLKYESFSITRTRAWRKQRDLWATRVVCILYDHK